MKLRHYSTLSKALFAAVSLSLTIGLHADWRQFRGPEGNGLAPNEKAPIALDAAKSLAWKRTLPGRGLSSPIIVAGKVFVTCSSGPDQERLHLLCFDAKDGQPIWSREFWATGRTMCHQSTSVAAPTPVSDGENIIAFYSSNDLFCLDLEGNLRWLRGLTDDYPNASNSLGMSSSPVIADGVLVVQVENDSDSFAAGIDLASGMNLWRQPRAKRANWSSPVVYASNVALQGSKGVEVLEPKTGQVLWQFEQGASTIPSSTVGGNVLYVPSNGLVALTPEGEGQAPKELWQSSQLRPGTASPLIIGERLYLINGSDVLNCAKVDDGERLWRIRLEGPFSGSPVAAGSHLYAFNESGLGQVVELNDTEGNVVSTIELGEPIKCTPAISDGALYVRSDQTLWCFRE